MTDNAPIGVFLPNEFKRPLFFAKTILFSIGLFEILLSHAPLGITPSNNLVKNLMVKICTFEKLYLTLRPLSNLWRGTCMLLR